MGAHAWLPELRLLGERLCFDFANTVDPRHGEHPTDLLAGYPDLVGWGQRAGALTAREAESLLGEAERHPKRAATALEAAVLFVAGIVAIGVLVQLRGAVCGRAFVPA